MKNITNSIYYIVCIVILLFITKPRLLFKPDGTIREFGIGYDSSGYKKTLYNTQFILIISVVLISLMNKP